MNETEHLLVILGEECAEAAQRASKAIRFGMNDVEPGQGDTCVRRLERELAEVVAMAELLGLKIRDEDKSVKKLKVELYMEYARQQGTLEKRVEVEVEVIGMCPGCKNFIPRGFFACNGNGSHAAISSRAPQLESSSAEDLLRELLKAGAHEGPCTNDDDPYDSCSLHVEAAAKRAQAAREFLGMPKES